MAVEEIFNSAVKYYQANTQQVWMVLGGLVLLIVGYVIYQKYEYFKTLEVFKGKDLEERVSEDLFKRTLNMGEDINMCVYYGDMNKIGHASKKFIIDSPSDGTIAITSEQKQEIGEDMEDAVVFMITPESKFGKFVWFVTDKIFGAKKKTDFLIVNRDSFRTEHGRIVVNDNCNILNRGGVFVQSGHATENVVNEIVTNETYENILESLPNFVEKVNQFDSQHSQRLNRMDKLAEMDKKDLERMLNQH